MVAKAPKCSFCGRVRAGGMAGPTHDVYICADCVDLANEIIDLHHDAASPGDQADPPQEER